MKRLLHSIMMFLCITTVTCAAGKLLIFAIREDTTKHDKIEISDMWGRRFNCQQKIALADLSEWYVVADTNIKWRVLVVATQNLVNVGAILSSNTVPKFDAWKNANLDNPGRLQVRRADDYVAALTNAGLAKKPEPEPEE